MAVGSGPEVGSSGSHGVLGGAAGFPLTHASVESSSPAAPPMRAPIIKNYRKKNVWRRGGIGAGVVATCLQLHEVWRGAGVIALYHQRGLLERHLQWEHTPTDKNSHLKKTVGECLVTTSSGTGSFTGYL